jgi:hypothetical protein
MRPVAVPVDNPVIEARIDPSQYEARFSTT